MVCPLRRGEEPRPTCHPAPAARATAAATRSAFWVRVQGRRRPTARGGAVSAPPDDAVSAPPDDAVSAPPGERRAPRNRAPSWDRAPPARPPPTGAGPATACPVGTLREPGTVAPTSPAAAPVRRSPKRRSTSAALLV